MARNCSVFLAERLDIGDDQPASLAHRHELTAGAMALLSGAGAAAGVSGWWAEWSGSWLAAKLGVLAKASAAASARAMRV